jgi:DNA-binding response OmpR family regulator
MKTLIIEDERKVGEFIERALMEQGYSTRLAGTCADARHALSETSFDAVILDLGLPDGDGLELLRNWRASGVTVPVLILSARDAITDRIRGLDIGADDYLPKPFSLEEMLARVRSLLRRRASGGTQQQTVYEHAGIRLDLLARAATYEGREVELTNREFALLELFMQNVGRVVARSMISEKVWDTSFDMETNLIDVYVRRLRKKFEKAASGGNYVVHALIRTVRGTGYQMG